MMNIKLCFALFVAFICALNVVNCIYEIKNEIYVSCSFQPICKCSNTTLLCNNFTSLTQLQFNNSKNKYLFQTLIFQPLESIHFDNKFNATGLYTTSYANIIFDNFKSFDYSSTPLKYLNVTDNRRLLTLTIMNSNFEILHNGISLSSQCDFDFVKQTLHSSSLLSYANNIELYNVKFPQKLCPYLFYNLKITNLNIISPFNGHFQFMDVHNSGGANLSSKIQNFKISNTTIDKLDSTNIINYKVFEKVKTIRFENLRIFHIEASTFKRFTQLKELEFKNVDFKDFLNSSHKWLSSLNTNINVSINNESQVSTMLKHKLKLFIRQTIYNFSNDDFCYYKDYPHNHLVFSYIYPTNNRLECTCTLLWILQYSYKYIDDHDYNWSKERLSCLLLPKNVFEFQMRTCDFSKRFKDCEAKHSSIEYEVESYEYDDTNMNNNKKLDSKISTLSIVIIIIGVLCVISLVTSITYFFKFRKMRLNSF